jgi:hypothetical protein
MFVKYERFRIENSSSGVYKVNARSRDFIDFVHNRPWFF